MQDMENSEEALLRELEQRVKEALQQHSLEDVLEYLRHELWQFECSSLYATKGGIHGAPDWDKLSTLIRVIKKVLAKLESGEIKGTKRLMQTTFSDEQIEPWKTDFPLKVRLKEHRRRPRHTPDYGRGQTVIDGFI